MQISREEDAAEMSIRSLIVVILLVFHSPVGATDPKVAAGWAETLTATSGLLGEQHFEEARGRLDSLTRDMLDKLQPSKQANLLFTIALAQRAVAEAGVGKADEAVWLWHVAQNLDPTVRHVDLSSYGTAGQLLRDNVIRGPIVTCTERPRGTRIPAPKRRREPHYPEGARQFRDYGLVIIAIRLDAQGRPTDPRVIKARSATITYAAAEALRRWQFTPPKADDPLKDLPFCVTFNFRLQ